MLLNLIHLKIYSVKRLQKWIKESTVLPNVNGLHCIENLTRIKSPKHTYHLHIHKSNDFIGVYDIETTSFVMRLINEHSFGF